MLLIFLIFCFTIAAQSAASARLRGCNAAFRTTVNLCVTPDYRLLIPRSLRFAKPISQAASRKPRRFSRKNLFGKRPLLLPRNRLSAAACRAARGGSSPLRRGICGESRPRRTPPFGKHKPQNQMVGTCSERGGAGLSSNRKAILARQDANL